MRALLISDDYELVISKVNNSTDSNIYLSFLWFPQTFIRKSLYLLGIYIYKLVEFIKTWVKNLIKSLKIYKIILCYLR